VSLLLNCIGSAVYVGTIAGVIQTGGVATKVGLAYALTNVHAVAVMVVVSVMCGCLLWYGECSRGNSYCRNDCCNCQSHVLVIHLFSKPLFHYSIFELLHMKC
jgi:hypothetical protein